MMSAGWKLRTTGFAALLSVAVLCSVNPSFAQAPRGQKKAKKVEAKKVELQPLPSGPTGPVQQVPLDSIAAVPPQVLFQNNQLTINAPNSTLADILRAVRKQTGAEIDIPPAPERVVTHLGPGPARSVVADLLNGSRFNYVLLGSTTDDSMLTRVVLVAKSGPDNLAPMGTPPGQPGITQPGLASGPMQENQTDMNADSADDAANDDNNAVETPAAEPEQPPPGAAEQNAIKTPQQMLQEMQQRQMQLQQQQQQQGVPGSGMPPHPPQQQ
jgi:hypothetical protein